MPEISICFHETSHTFVLQTKNSTYQMAVDDHGILLHVYYGKKVRNTPLFYRVEYRERSFSGQPMDIDDARVSLDALPQEYPTFGSGDFRVPCFNVCASGGKQGVDLRYSGYEILDQKPPIREPMPYIRGEQIPTLVIYLQDVFEKVVVKLFYSVYYEEDAICRRAEICNDTAEDITILRALSFGLDEVAAEECITFPGAWAAERQLQRQIITKANCVWESVRGSSGHHQNPGIILCNKNTDENMGEAYGALLVYSGNFQFSVQKDFKGSVRLTGGISPSHFSWKLKPTESFETPEVALVYSQDGFTALSLAFHDLLRRYVIPNAWQKKPRPILLNSWEACYFDFDGAKLLRLAKEAAKVGIEMLVMDDGWFGARDNDKKALGDWVVNEKKLGMTLEELSIKIKAMGLLFGIWIEPEMISEDSDLYRAHPTWVLRVGQRPYIRSRHQLVLDMSRDDVVDYLTEKMSAVLSSAEISYVKWDMNRSLSDVWSEEIEADRQGEVYHRYMLGVYELARRLTTKFPHILWEGCSGGGGRFDAGMLFYFPQIWCSDNTDAYARLFIQYGTSFFYPMECMGTHISICPNHQTGRTTPMDMRFAVAMGGAFGYELDFAHLNETEKDQIHWQIMRKKSWESIFTESHYYRLTNPNESDLYAAWEFAKPDQSEAILFVVWLKAMANPPTVRIRVKGLKQTDVYLVNGKGRYGGDALMHAGLLFENEHTTDYRTCWYLIQKIE